MKRHTMGLLTLLLGLLQTKPIFADTNQMIVIDVRTMEEYEESHVVQSLNFDIMSSDFKAKVEKLDKNKMYKVYCRSGNRSGQAEKVMRALGFKNVENIGSVSQAAKKLNRTCEGKSC